MEKRLRAVVIGAGWAGKGQTRALQHVGVEVAAICARVPEVVRAVADDLGVAEASVDWRRTLAAVQPEIVALATPASLRGEVVEAAAEMGAHVFCAKPLATTAAEAHRLYRLAEVSGIKHAYAVTHHYDPSVAWLRELIADDVIGPLREIVATFRYAFNPLTPWSWAAMLASGGGALNNALPQLLAIMETITGVEVARVMGEARVLTAQAPLIPGLHDFREMAERGRALTPEAAEQLEWRVADGDDAFSALMRLGPPEQEIEVTVVLGAGRQVGREANGMRLYGDTGTLLAVGLSRYEVIRRSVVDKTPEALEVPQRLRAALPDLEDDLEAKWAAPAREFVADIRGERHAPYLTFRDGWRYQQAIDAIRAERGWEEIRGSGVGGGLDL